MKTALILATLALCCYAQQMAPLLAENSSSRVPGQYIVVFKDNITDELVSFHKQTVKDLMDSHGNKTNAILREFQISKVRAYSAHMDDKLRDHVRGMEHVEYVECNQLFHATQAPCTNQPDATWGLVRTTYRNSPTSDDYSYEYDAGEGVDVYIIDTGIDTSHPDFGGRAYWGADFVDNPSPKTDLNGHGTHCAGTVMSNTWGVAKKATAIAVRVLDENGSGTTDGIIDGVIYVIRQYYRYRNKSVVNMSVGGGRSRTLNYIVDRAVEEGIHIAVAAGNEDQNACNSSPASASKCVTVGASDEDDQFAYFSNYGSCVDIIAPGVAITSTWLNGQTNTISGTSMATPHVAGIMAKYLSSMPYNPSPEYLSRLLIRDATPNKIEGIPDYYTPNLLVFRDCP